MINVDKFVHNENAEPPIDITEFGIVMLVNEVHNENAELLIFSTFSPMNNVDKFEHDENAELPIDITESLILIEISEVHSQNAPDGIELISQQIITCLVTFI